MPIKQILWKIQDEIEKVEHLMEENERIPTRDANDMKTYDLLQELIFSLSHAYHRMQQAYKEYVYYETHMSMKKK